MMNTINAQNLNMCFRVQKVGNICQYKVIYIEVLHICSIHHWISLEFYFKFCFKHKKRILNV
jgi:hypothetical protein